ncbi:uncharacterized protein LOC132696283 [Cylas formicarius]|uniref:uncharacterized protein LOC132696283 n=1 Tax=Cylas formicarius TaxID=197179 RepID=UPI00295881A7|nr:uncharacterized protein LOC132696283 [Cylas formicarius]
MKGTYYFMGGALLFITCCLLVAFADQQKVTYSFTEFPYKETNKNEIMYREIEAACERGCLGRNRVSKVLCIRQCISPSCYRDLYQSDLLEEGEVDVRFNSFKGCFIQRYNRSRL